MKPKVMKPRILCLHGKNQTSTIFMKKMTGVRRKLEPHYELHFLDGPIQLETYSNVTTNTTTTETDCSTNVSHNKNNDKEIDHRLAWWVRDEIDPTKYYHVREAIEYVVDHCRKQKQIHLESKNQVQQQQQTTTTMNNNNNIVMGVGILPPELEESSPQEEQKYNDYDYYDAILGFSQGGTFAVVLAGILPNIQAVITAGAPHHEVVFQQVNDFILNQDNNTTRATTTTATGISNCCLKDPPIHESVTLNDKDTNNNEIIHSLSLSSSYYDRLRQIPMVHWAGKTDQIVSIESTQSLMHQYCNNNNHQNIENGSSNNSTSTPNNSNHHNDNIVDPNHHQFLQSQIRYHEQGHLFPTRAEYTNSMLAFLQQHLIPRGTTNTSTEEDHEPK